MSVINDVDFDQIKELAIAAVKNEVDENWDEVKEIVSNVGDGLTNDIEFIARKKLSGEFNEDDAAVFLEDQKMLARIRLRSIAIITLQLAERIWNAIANVFRDAAFKALGWTVL